MHAGVCSCCVRAAEQVFACASHFFVIWFVRKITVELLLLVYFVHTSSIILRCSLYFSCIYLQDNISICLQHIYIMLNISCIDIHALRLIEP